nr:MAG: hypothetical protein 2 [Tombusviridae sp.]
MVKKKSQKKMPRVKVAKAKSEVTALGKALRVLGGYGGGLAGGLLGQSALGAQAGTGLGAALSRWLGQGDYALRSNSLVSSLRADGTIPAMHRNDQTIVVRHKEYVGELRGRQLFTTQFRYPLNPGVATTFPWLHTVASQYSEYRIRGMVFHYVPTSGMSVASSNTALGSVMFQTSYRATEDAPTSKLEMMNEYWATEGRPCDEICHPIECDPKENPFNVQYVRSTPLSPSENILMYDLGVTTVAVTGQQADGNVLGDIWCSYEVELKKPKVSGINTEGSRSVRVLSTSGISTAAPLGTSQTTNSSIDGVTFTGNSVTFPANSGGEYLLSWFTNGFSSAGGFSVAYSGGATAISTLGLATGSSSAVQTQVFRLDPQSVSSTLTFSASTLTGATGVVLRITEYNSTFE